MPAPFEERSIRATGPDQPPVSQTAAYCDAENWSGVHVARGHIGGEFRVDESEWKQSLASAQVGLASYLSQCQEHGGSVTIVAERSGETLARYDPRTGLAPVAR